MNPFWNKIVMTLAVVAAVVSARYGAAWVANHTWRADRYQAATAAQQAAAHTPRPTYSASVSSVSNFRLYDVTERQIAEIERRKAANPQRRP